MNPLRVGVIGVGHMGRIHALNVAKLPQAILTGVFAQDISHSQQVAAETGCKAFEDLDSLLAAVDAVSIAVPTDRHLEVGLAALRHDVHCLMEKPIALNLEQADRLIAEAAKRNLVLQVGHIERYNPAVRALADWKLAPRFVEAHRLAPYNARGTEVSVVLDLMIHDIDLVLNWIDSPVSRIDASGAAVVSDGADIATARIAFENGAAANLTASRISQNPMRKMRLFQKGAYFSVDFLSRESEIYGLETDPDPSQDVRGEMGIGQARRFVTCHRPPIDKALGMEAQLDAFIRTVRGETGLGVSGDQARRALAVALEIQAQIHPSVE